MRLTLSSAAAPDATLAELAAGARRRGIRALELVEGHGHGLTSAAAAADWAGAAATAKAGGVVLAAFRCEAGPVRAAAGVCETVLVPAAAGAAGSDGVLEYADAAELIVAARAQPEARFAWVVRPGEQLLEEAAPAVLAAAGARLVHVRLHGGGPEAAAQEGLGVGALMRHMALAGFAGNLAIAPSGSRYRVVWSAWLGRRGGWGCGSKAAERESLPVATLEGK